MKKTIRQYLREKMAVAMDAKYMHSANHLRTAAAPGHEEAFAEARRDVEIIDELLLLVEDYPTSDDPDVMPESQNDGKQEEINAGLSRLALYMLRKIAFKETETAILETRPLENLPKTVVIDQPLASNEATFFTQVYATGIAFNQQKYFCDDLIPYIGHRVQVIPSPFDELRVCTSDGQYLCTATRYHR